MSCKSDETNPYPMQCPSGNYIADDAVRASLHDSAGDCTSPSNIDSFDGLVNVMASDLSVTITADITFTSQISISGKTGLTISSTVDAKLISDQSFTVTNGGLFYIDGASAIDSEDTKWLLFAVTRARADDSTKWSLTSFATVYEFFVYPGATRARLSQIVVLPPYQRKGLGGKMLESVRMYSKMKEFADVTVEDPTPQLQRLRDASDVRAMCAVPEVMAAVQRYAMPAARLQPGGDAGAAKGVLEMPKDVAAICRDSLKICAPQARRCWEALLFMTAKKAGAPDDSPAAMAFQELVIRRLKALHCSDARRDAGSKRVYNHAQGRDDREFVMCRGVSGGQAPDMEEDGDKADPAEVLADYFHDTMSNLAWLATAVKI